MARPQPRRNGPAANRRFLGGCRSARPPLSASAGTPACECACRKPDAPQPQVRRSPPNPRRGACWPRATADRPVTAGLIKPLGYRLPKGGKLLYGQPADLLVAGEPADLRQVVQAYLLRWQIAVSFRDEKTILGAGKAQVWNPRSVERAPAFLVACHAAMLLASISALGGRRNEQFEPLAPWRQDKVRRPSARDLVRLLGKPVVEERKPRNAKLENAAWQRHLCQTPDHGHQRPWRPTLAAFRPKLEATTQTPEAPFSVLQGTRVSAHRPGACRPHPGARLLQSAPCPPARHAQPHGRRRGGWQPDVPDRGTWRTCQ